MKLPKWRQKALEVLKARVLFEGSGLAGTEFDTRTKLYRTTWVTSRIDCLLDNEQWVRDYPDFEAMTRAKEDRKDRPEVNGKSVPQWHIDLLLVIRSRVLFNRASFSSDPKEDERIKEGCRPFMRTWVIPIIDALLEGDRDRAKQEISA